MRRLSAEYNWPLTKEDILTWAEFAAQYPARLFAEGVVAHMADTTPTNTGSPVCTFRPKIGQVAGHIDRIVEARQTQTNSVAQRKMYRQWKKEAATPEQARKHMATLREQFPTMFRTSGEGQDE